MRLSLLLPARRHLQATMTVAHWLALHHRGAKPSIDIVGHPRYGGIELPTDLREMP